MKEVNCLKRTRKHLLKKKKKKTLPLNYYSTGLMSGYEKIIKDK